MVQKTPVIVVDDVPDITEVCRRLIEAEPDLTCVGVLHAADGLADAVGRLRPAVVVIDLSMPGQSPLTAVRETLKSHPDCRVLAYSAYDDDGARDRVRESGAWGLVSKAASPRELVRAIRAAARGEKLPN